MAIEKTTVFGLALAGALALGGAARADEWDIGEDTDNGGATDDVLFHGSEQIHDLGVVGALPDEDWYLTANRAFSSYEAVIDGMTGDLDLTSADMQRLDVSGTTVLDNALVSDFGGNLRLNCRLSGPERALPGRTSRTGRRVQWARAGRGRAGCSCRGSPW